MLGINCSLEQMRSCEILSKKTIILKLMKNIIEEKNILHT